MFGKKRDFKSEDWADGWKEGFKYCMEVELPKMKDEATKEAVKRWSKTLNTQVPKNTDK